MPKVEYTHGKGLFQSSGSGVELSGGSDDDLTLSIKVLQEDVSFTAATNQTTTATVPAGAIVLGGSVKVLTANGNTTATCVMTVATDDSNISGTLACVSSTVGSSASGAVQHDNLNAASAALGIKTTWNTATDATGSYRVTAYYLSVA